MKKIVITFTLIMFFFTIEAYASSWKLLPGSAKDIGIGSDGSVWVIGTNATGGGYGIWKWGENKWFGIDGGAVRIDVDPKGNPWVVNSVGHIYQRTGAGWKKMPGSAKDIGIGSDGSVWVIGTNPTGGGYGIWKWGGNEWFGIDGGAVKIDVDPKGNPWVVNSAGHIYQRTGGKWIKKPGLAKDIGIGAEGSVWVIGTNATGGGYGIWKWTGHNWAAIDGGAVHISVGKFGLPWVVNSADRIYKHK